MSWRARVAEVLAEPPPPAASRVEPSTRAPVVEAAAPAELDERLLTLRSLPSPSGISDARWRIILDRAGRLSMKWGRVALAMGWAADDLLGVDPSAWMRLDRRGALFLHTDGEVVGVTSEAVVVRVGSTNFHIGKRRS